MALTRRPAWLLEINELEFRLRRDKTVSESRETQKQSRAKRVAPRASTLHVPPLPNHVTAWGILGVKTHTRRRLLKEVFMFFRGAAVDKLTIMRSFGGLFGRHLTSYTSC